MLRILDHAKGLTPTELASGGSGFGNAKFQLMQLDNEVKEAQEALHEAQNPSVDADGKRRVNARLVAEAEAKEAGLVALRLRLGASLAHRRDASDAARRQRLDFIERAGFGLCHERSAPRDLSELKDLDASAGPFLKLLCADGACSGRLKVPLTEGDTVIGRDWMEPPHITLPTKFVQPRHCRVTNDAGKMTLKPLSEGADVFINGEQIDSGLGNAVSLRHADTLILGAAACCFEVVYWQQLIDDVRTGKRTDLKDDAAYTPETVDHWFMKVHEGKCADLIEEFNKEHDLDDDADAPPPEVEDDIQQLLGLVQEANHLAAYMNQDYLFELQLKNYTFDSMTSEGVKEHDKVIVTLISCI